MNLPPLPFIVLDTETTGLFPRVHKIVELALVHVEKGKITDRYEQLYTIDDDLPPHVQVLTRIRPEDLEGKPTFKEHLNDIRVRIGPDTLLIGQNLGFDIDMLRAEGLDLRENPWVDTSMLASLVFPELASYSLGYMSVVLGLRHDPVHRALGDVHATLELFGKIWERIEKLPLKHLTVLRTTFARSTSGYQYLAECFPKISHAQSLPWSIPTRETIGHDTEHFSLPPTTPETITLLEDSLDPHTLHHLINTLRKQKGKTTWFAVKNLEATLRRAQLPDDICVLHPPLLLLDPDAALRLQKQSTFTSDEATLAVKLHWFPARVREDLPIHGGERDVWNGKLACTDTSPPYIKQFQNLPPVILLDHRQLLHLLANTEHAVHTALRPDHTIVIDDASMLEDTATKAYGHFLQISDLRAASVGHALLTKFTDLLELWGEKLRGQNDIHLFQKTDFARRETKGLREQLEGTLADDTLPSRTREHLSTLASIIEDRNENTTTWIESRQQKTTLHAAPADVALLLRTYLFSRFETVLLSPPGFQKIPEITSGNPVVHPSPLIPPPLRISFPDDGTVTTTLENPPTGKTVLLLPSKRVIEEQFVRFTDRLEKRGMSLICQGLSGGQGRMEAEFSAATGSALILLTPWTYEGFELSLGTIDHLIIDTLPFDHPSDLLIQIRSKHFSDPFTEYTLPRLKLRLFRLLRTFCRHRTPNGDVSVLDKRIHEKKYGGEVRTYLEGFSSPQKDSATQLSMF